MDAARKRAYIKQQATLEKQQREGQPPKGMGSANPSAKRKQPEKTDRLPKKPKTVPEPVLGLKAETKKTVTPLGPGKGKGLMMGFVPITKKPPVLFREDSKYALEHLSSIITANDYEDLSNHAIEAMGETGLFSIAQVLRQSTFSFPSLQLALLLTLLSSSNGNDERVDG